MRKKIMKCIKHNDGMTLVEIVVSIALLGIVASMTLMIFTSSLMLAINSGDNTNVTGIASAEMNQSILDKTSGSSIKAVVYFKQDGTNASPDVNGKFITIDASSDKNDTTMKAFVPD